MKWFTILTLILVPGLVNAGEGFEKMMDSFDSGTFRGRESFRQSVIHVLNSEELDPAEFRMVRAALNQVNQIEPTVLFQRIENEVGRLEKIFETVSYPKGTQWIRFCKQKFPVEIIKLIVTDTLKIPVFIESETFRSISTNTRDLPFIKWPVPVPRQHPQVADRPEKKLYSRDWPLK